MDPKSWAEIQLENFDKVKSMLVKKLLDGTNEIIKFIGKFSLKEGKYWIG